MKKRLPQQVIKVRNYGDAWVNRLAVICNRFEQMENDRERVATLRFLIDKYRDVLAPDRDQLI